MTTQSSPTDFGLPSAESLAISAARYFPEFAERFSSAQVITPEQAPENFIAPQLFPSGATAAHAPALENLHGGHIAIGGRSIESIRADFPILNEQIESNRLVWLDNAATTQRQQSVIDRIAYFYAHENSNIHRAAHTLAARATDAYEAARGKVADFIGAPSAENIVFTRGTTEAINLAAQSFVKPLLKEGDEIILTTLEHHANIVPWQMIAQETGAVLRIAPIDESGQIILSEYQKLFTPRTKFVSAAHVSNALGTIAPINELIGIAHAHRVGILIDAAQSLSHIPLNVSVLDPDVLVFSGHKIFAPTGIGALYARKEILDAGVPYQGGGNMIIDVTFERTIYQSAPAKYEAGTGNIADAVGLGAALDYVSQLGVSNIYAYEHALLEYATRELQRIDGLRLIGTADHKTSILSFVLRGFENERVGKYLNGRGIAVRSGHHCAQPVLRRFGLEGTVRPSIAFYNTFDEIDLLVASLQELVKQRN